MILLSASSRRRLQRPVLSASRDEVRPEGCSRFYARLDFNHDFGPPEAAFRQRFSVECDVEVLWTEAGNEPIGRETLAAWEKEFQELVRESAPASHLVGFDGWLDAHVVCDDHGPPGSQQQSNGIADIPFPSKAVLQVLSSRMSRLFSTRMASSVSLTLRCLWEYGLADKLRHFLEGATL